MTRMIVGLTGVVLLPVSSVIVSWASLNNSEKEETNKGILGISLVMLVGGLNEAISAMLTVSVIQGIRKDNIKKLLDESKFLIHGNMQEIKTMQYVVVATGVRDFTSNVIPLFVSLPTYVVSSVANLVYINKNDKSSTTLLVILGFTSATASVVYLFSKGLSLYNSYNQKLENELVKKISFIEENSSSISIMGASKAEHISLKDNLQKITNTIPNYSLLATAFYTLNSIFPSISSKFLGSFYTNDDIEKLDVVTVSLMNVLIVQITYNIQQIVWILTNNFAYIKINLEQLKAFDNAYNNCLAIRSVNNKMVKYFEGDNFVLKNFSVYCPNAEDEILDPIVLFNQLNLTLFPNKVYKLVAESGKGKTTFLKAITNNWQYTDGEVVFPKNTKDSICFVPQHSFIPPGILLSILTYPLTPKEFVEKYYIERMFLDQDNIVVKVGVNTVRNYHELSEQEFESEDVIDPVLQSNKLLNGLIKKAKILLEKVGLLPEKINENELEETGIVWTERLSGGERQKLVVIQALLKNPSLIIMDEAVSALDSKNREVVYRLIKDYLTTKECTVIYTEHGTTPNFADESLVIIGESLEFCNDIFCSS